MKSKHKTGNNFQLPNIRFYGIETVLSLSVFSPWSITFFSRWWIIWETRFNLISNPHDLTPHIQWGLLFYLLISDSNVLGI